MFLLYKACLFQKQSLLNKDSKFNHWRCRCPLQTDREVKRKSDLGITVTWTKNIFKYQIPTSQLIPKHIPVSRLFIFWMCKRAALHLQLKLVCTLTCCLDRVLNLVRWTWRVYNTFFLLFDLFYRTARYPLGRPVSHAQFPKSNKRTKAECNIIIVLDANIVGKK